MKQGSRLLICALGACAGALSLSVAAQSATLTITVVTTFDYPGVGNSTTAYGINRRGDITGDYLDSSNVRRGFVRLSNGSFSAPIVEPNDTATLRADEALTTRGRSTATSSTSLTMPSTAIS